MRSRITILSLFIAFSSFSQNIEVIDKKGTIKTIESSKWALSANNIFNLNPGNVGIGNTNPQNRLEVTGVANSAISGLRLTGLGSVSPTTPLSNVLAVNANGDVVVTTTTSTNNSWLLTGNTNATGSHFLGTTNDVILSLRSNNTPMFEVGRRQTLGLYDASSTGIFPYNQQNASVSYIRGTGGVSALQFESSGAAFYKPLFFTDQNGNFAMRGSSAGTDFFEIGSAGTANSGRLNFTIGDDGDEPMVFTKYNYNTQTYVEMVRMQGTGLNTDVRVGIDVNGSTPNSTLQVDGSFATNIITTTGNITLNQDHHTVILNGDHTVTLPVASTCAGRIYVVKNPNSFATTISSYVDLEGNSAITTINNHSTIWLQSNGTNWQQVSKSEKTYEKIVIWAEESAALANNTLEWSFGAAAEGQTGIPIPEDWEAYAVSFNADVSTAGATVQMAVVNSTNDSNLFTFTASGATNNIVFTQLLTTPVSIPAGTSIGFRTVSRTGNVSNARVAVWLRR